MKRALVSLAVSTGLVYGQGGIAPLPVTPPDFPAWPEDWNVSQFAPVVDTGGQPVPRRVLCCGSTDFDRDGNRDLWFMTESGPGQTQVHALLANTADLGRYWPWSDYAASGLRDAATYRSLAAYDMVLAVDPASDRLQHHFFVPNAAGPDPRLGGFWGRNPGWPIGLGCYEIETANHDGDAHDDILVLRDAGAGRTDVRLIRMGAPFGGIPSPQHEVVLTLPVGADSLRALDADGDQQTDAVVHVPGLGVFVLRSGEKTFTIADFLPLVSGLRDLCVGDVDRNGRDEVGVVVDGGIILLDGSPWPRLLANAAGVGPIGSARIADFDRSGSPDVVAMLASGDGLLVHQQGRNGFEPPVLHRPFVPAPGGSGALGQSMLTVDVDRDGDDDVLVQMRNGGFVTLRSLTALLGPASSTVVHEGRFSESYIAERIELTFPPAWRSAGIDTVEVGIYMRHPTLATRPWVLWGHTEIPLAANQALAASVRLLYLVDLSRLPLLTSAYLYPQGFSVSGDTMLSVHGKVGQRRCESMLIYHQGRGDENRSTLGVQWKVIAAPPLPRADAQLLPF